MLSMTRVTLFGGLAVAALTPTVVHADENCTQEPKTKWMAVEKMKELIDAAGYTKYEKVLVSGSCYEIYGTNKDGKQVEVYFNPTNAAVFKETIQGASEKGK